MQELKVGGQYQAPLWNSLAHFPHPECRIAWLLLLQLSEQQWQ